MYEYDDRPADPFKLTDILSRKILTIKQVRDYTGCGLIEAKNCVEAFFTSIDALKASARINLQAAHDLNRVASAHADNLTDYQRKLLRQLAEDMEPF